MLILKVLNTPAMILFMPYKFDLGKKYWFQCIFCINAFSKEKKDLRFIIFCHKDFSKSQNFKKLWSFYYSSKLTKDNDCLFLFFPKIQLVNALYLIKYASLEHVFVILDSILMTMETVSLQLVCIPINPYWNSVSLAIYIFANM